MPSGTSASNKYSRSQSESSSLSQADNATAINRSKNYLITHRKQQKSSLIESKLSSNNTSTTKAKTTAVIDYFDNNEQNIKSNDQWGDWEDSNFTTNNRYQQSYSNDRRSHQQNLSDDLTQKSSRLNEQTNDYNRTKQQSSKTRSNGNEKSSCNTFGI